MSSTSPIDLSYTQYYSRIYFIFTILKNSITNIVECIKYQWTLSHAPSASTPETYKYIGGIRNICYEHLAVVLIAHGY